jgi:hypothetical protein
MKSIYPLSFVFLHFAFLSLAGQAFGDTTSVRPISESRLRLTPWNTAAFGTGMAVSAIALDLGVEAYYRRYRDEKNGDLAAHWRTRTKQCELGRNITMGLGLASLAASAVLAHKERGRGKEQQGKSFPTPEPVLGWRRGQVTLALMGRF